MRSRELVTRPSDCFKVGFAELLRLGPKVGGEDEPVSRDDGELVEVHKVGAAREVADEEEGLRRPEGVQLGLGILREETNEEGSVPGVDCRRPWLQSAMAMWLDPRKRGISAGRACSPFFGLPLPSFPKRRGFPHSASQKTTGGLTQAFRTTFHSFPSGGALLPHVENKRAESRPASRESLVGTTMLIGFRTLPTATRQGKAMPCSTTVWRVVLMQLRLPACVPRARRWGERDTASFTKGGGSVVSLRAIKGPAPGWSRDRMLLSMDILKHGY